MIKTKCKNLYNKDQQNKNDRQENKKAYENKQNKYSL